MANKQSSQPKQMPVFNSERLSTLIRIYRAASAVRDYELERESARQLLEEFGVDVPCQTQSSRS